MCDRISTITEKIPQHMKSPLLCTSMLVLLAVRFVREQGENTVLPTNCTIAQRDTGDMKEIKMQFTGPGKVLSHF